MLKRCGALCLFVIAATFLLCACSQTGTEEAAGEEDTQAMLDVISDLEASTDTNEYAAADVEEQGLMHNENVFLLADNWIYGQGWDQNGSSQLVKVRTDSSDWTILDSCWPRNVLLCENYLYYSGSSGSEYGIYKMRTSGEDKQKIVSAYGELQIVGDSLYYTDAHFEITGDITNPEDGDAHLYRCDLNGNNIVEIIAKPTFYFYVFGDKILYQDDRDNCSLHLCNLDGTGDTKLNDCISYWPIIDGDTIYYVREDTLMDYATRTIWKMNLDGSNQEQVSDCSVFSGMFIKGEYIYFVYYDDNNRIYRIKKDGSGIELVTQDENVVIIQPMGEKIAYIKYSEGFNYVVGDYIANLDGGSKWEFKSNT